MINLPKETVSLLLTLSTPEDLSCANPIKDISKKKVPDNPLIWQTTWWACKAPWWMEWKETSWWWLPQFQLSFGSTPSFQDFCQPKFLSHSLKNSNPWPNQESVSKISMSVMYQEHLSISLSCLVWDKSTVCF